MENMSKLAMFCGIAGLVCNILMVSYSGISLGIPLGIFGIAFAILSKDELRQMPKKAKTALGLSIISLAIGVLLFAITIMTAKVMADPEMSREVIDTLKAFKDQMPQGMRDMFEQYGFPLE